jgi:aspartyl-tRNA(Asn)/glutamyl-tRNA(Gln) amidotransferase subunit C
MLICLKVMIGEREDKALVNIPAKQYDQLIPLNMNREKQMAVFDEESLIHLTRLCRIECTSEELKKLSTDLKKILSYVEQLQQIDTSKITPLSHVLEDITPFTRDDVEGELLPRKDFLDNAPDQIGGLVRFPPVLKST